MGESRTQLLEEYSPYINILSKGLLSQIASCVLDSMEYISPLKLPQGYSGMFRNLYQAKSKQEQKLSKALDNVEELAITAISK
ncbi:CLUMA_CG001344, isoform A [Clunio marinus]|uniref:CLUMA_CG001344, isoform A n=1 Tax=Clunio marinus TaxID=568069 RepID=A0A1J1HI21_9DIPT|nr:CLUMA_CG001344, isoform A [Clunio marinus]